MRQLLQLRRRRMLLRRVLLPLLRLLLRRVRRLPAREPRTWDAGNAGQRLLRQRLRVARRGGGVVVTRRRRQLVLQAADAAAHMDRPSHIAELMIGPGDSEYKRQE